MRLFRLLLDAYKKWRKERLLKRIGFYGDTVAGEYEVKELRADVDAILKILGYERRSVFSVYFGEKGDRFHKRRKR